MPTKKDYISVTKPKVFLDKSPKAKSVSLFQDIKTKMYFVKTHRWQSKQYKTIGSIPKSIIEFCESTG